ncbi:endoplasmic Reticulum Oxidoreductin 1 [Beauveria bassiana ARSEF 2860]|uniref:Autophagy-related protein 14 n=1 Tax=Beauveria bassiana (strain ARSEF 2860) TaxID=655819 RepID=J4KM37_BEAB2|nr:endoplasmic Reticulum Oxidoreductin 1 [Beauveria bassiana ARSEF 2860]EJP63274.1 endoplasmic Reticulum Oxidoreductin 1 [Beauveria bassiana ARSEF 2860]
MKSAGKLFFLSVFALCAAPGICTDASKDGCPISPKAIVDDACVSYATLDKLNTRVKPAVDDLTQTTDFFSHYRLNLFHKSCPFWDDSNGLCGNIGCAVETLDNEDDIPDVWKVKELSKLQGPLAKHPGRASKKEHRPLHGELGDSVGESCVYDNDDECDERDYCVPEDESAFSKGDYVSLTKNPERFTGYAGLGSHMVWDAIYRENCFQRSSFPRSADVGTSLWPKGPAAMDFKQVMEAAGRQAQLDQNRLQKPETPFVASTGLETDDECLEKRVFYRVVSGMHASISTHLCWDYLNKTTGLWGPNFDCYMERLHPYPDRISNLYFNYALVTRAVAKLGPYLQKPVYTFCTDDAHEDASTRGKVLKVTQRAALVPEIFDESIMFVNGEGPSLKEDFRNRFRNISRLMDCVGCDKCRLWGKVQTNGYGTALKVLFEFGKDNDKDVPVLKRTELVALFNTYGRLTKSLMAIAQFRKMAVEAEDQRKAAELLAETAKDIREPLDHPLTSNEDEELSDELVDLIRKKNRGSAGEDWKSQVDHELALFKLAMRVVFTGWIRAPVYFVKVAIAESTQLYYAQRGRDYSRPPSAALPQLSAHLPLPQTASRQQAHLIDLFQQPLSACETVLSQHNGATYTQWPHTGYESPIPAPARSPRTTTTSTTIRVAVAIMSLSSMTSLPAPPPRRPRLLAQNRKLRHLCGLSLRNLSFAPPTARILRSADDGDLPHGSNKKKPTTTTTTTTNTTQKLPVLQETSSDVAPGAALHPSRSSDHLAGKEAARRLSASGGGGHRIGAPLVQRRASLSNAPSSPASRQKKLEELADEAVGDVFFSLHDPASPEEPIYISETGERSASAWTFLLEELIDLRKLHFISTTLNREYRPNALIFHLEDGVYSLDFPDCVSEPRQQAQPTTTSSYNALMKLANLESSLRDAEETRRAVVQQINDVVVTTAAGGSADGAADAAEESVVLAGKYLATQRRLNSQAERRRDELRTSLRVRRDAIAAGKALQRSRADDMASGKEKMVASRRLLDDTAQQIRGQRRRICADLAAVFPIAPIPHAPPLSFTICGIPLPNSVYDAGVARSVGEDALSAALGLVALLACHLQFYLGYPLPYPLVTPLVGSRTYIRDEISHLDASSASTTANKAGTASSRREFPLFLPRGGSTTSQWRFEYAWFLLNKDLETLCAAQGLRVVDVRHTLPNLKYLLYVGSAGSDEVPARKKGGVRGLWAGRLAGRVPELRGGGGDGSSTGGSRPGSADSEAHAQRGEVLVLREPMLADEQQHQEQQQQPLAVGWGVAGGGGMNSDFALPFENHETKFTLRTKGLRENVAG